MPPGSPLEDGYADRRLDPEPDAVVLAHLPPPACLGRVEAEPLAPEGEQDELARLEAGHGAGNLQADGKLVRRADAAEFEPQLVAPVRDAAREVALEEAPAPSRRAGQANHDAAVGDGDLVQRGRGSGRRVAEGTDFEADASALPPKPRGAGRRDTMSGLILVQPAADLQWVLLASLGGPPRLASRPGGGP